MKKTLSILTALLCIFSNFGTKGHEITPMPDGGKKIVCKYDDLPWLTKQYENTIQNVKKNGKTKTSAAYIASDIVTPVGAVGGITGAIVTIYECTADTKIHGGKVAAGVALTVAGMLALVGAPACAYNVASTESKKLADLETEKSAIEATKQRIDTYISSNLITESEAKKSFRYTIFTDKKGFVYKKERTGGGLPYEVIELEKKSAPLPIQKYKLDICTSDEKNSQK
ncbi:MAG: hypothetical protein Q4D57_03525 [Clostridia bacterium]|nr:hypothetical protein [Clostridia bacterium]